jgi:hypothetical protein
MSVPIDRIYLVDPRCCGCSAIKVRPFEWYVTVENDWDVSVEHVQVDVIGHLREVERSWRRRIRRAWEAIRGRDVILGFELMHPDAVDDLIRALRKAKAEAWQ